jgi:hypothetical protein
MDLSPKRAGAPVVSARQPGQSKSAAALHSRVKTGQVLDLRAATPAAKPLTKVIARPEHHIPAAPPKSTAHERHLAHITERLDQAKAVGRSPKINKFAGESGKALSTSTVMARREEPAAVELPALVTTQHEAMTRLVAPVVPEPAAAAKPLVSGGKGGWRPHLGLSPYRGRTLATATAVAIMVGYVWVQNYPKLALQAASSKAGLTASLPGYVPSSYTLAHTDTVPGTVTLSFSSPSAGEALKIAQARTSWDSSSLLDNFVAKNTDDYATVQGQGLTIYLFNNNQATWVNHGTWYSIIGAARLSREQVLKIAYSL